MCTFVRCNCLFFFFSSRRRHTRCSRDWSSDVCSSDLLVTPVGIIATTTPTYTGNAVASATQYLLWVDDSSGGRIRQWYTATQAGCAGGTGACSLTPSVELTPGAGQWWIVTANASGNGPWSARMAFTVAGTPPPGPAEERRAGGGSRTPRPPYHLKDDDGAAEDLPLL